MQGKLTIKGFGPKSPMAEVEPQLVQLIIKMSRIRRCLTPSQCLHLANDLISGTETEQKVIAYKKKLYPNIELKSGQLGTRYWRGFQKIWEHVLTSKRGQKFALDRASATTFTNMAKMYTDVYEAMVECGVAKELEDRKSTRLNSSHSQQSRMPSSA